ncbi:hypothetical protein ACFQ4C_18105 [Larkinella insperata]|uniref:Pectate lyase superfamily protein domain-containing protein n=1 Tax=Larkinella insperata TaxID=332158 RepID=A0ABW3QEZ4_9BACT|nr:hypothetical protein [Larkinella insperata]
MRKFLLLLGLLYTQLSVAQIGYKMTGAIKQGQRNVTIVSGPGSATVVGDFDASLPGTINQANTSVAGELPVSNGQNGLHIFDYTKVAKPGEFVHIHGQFDTTATAHFYVNGGTRFSQLLPPVGYVKNKNNLTVQIPVMTPLGEYKLFIKDGSGRSEFVCINQAEGWGMDSKVIYAGTKFMITGDNLTLGDRRPTLRLRDVVSGSYLPATFVAARSNRAATNWKMPLGVTVGRTYELWVSNGYSAETKMAQTVSAVTAPARDYFDIGTGWAAYFPKSLYDNVYNLKTDSRLTTKATGDGVANERSAFLEAMADGAADGGAVLDLGEGTFNLTTSSSNINLNVPDGIVFRGAGRGRTTILYSAASATQYFLSIASGDARVGFVGITFKNTDTGASDLTFSDIEGDNIFFNDCDIQLGLGRTMEVNGAEHFAFIRSRVGQSGSNGIRGPFRLFETSKAVVRDSEIPVTQSWSTYNCRELFIYRNVVMRDIAKPKIDNVIYHSLTLDFCWNSYIGENEFPMINGPSRKSDGSLFQDDGETIICEAGGAKYPNGDTGTITSATATVLTVNSRSGATSFTTDVTEDTWLQITYGKGEGQLVRAVSRTANTITLAEPLKVIPDGTSGYATLPLGLKNVNFYNNNFSNQQRAYFIYFAPYSNVRIYGGLIKNSQGVAIVQIQRYTDNLTTKPKYTPGRNLVVEDVEVDGSTDAVNDGVIGLRCNQEKIPDTWGPQALNSTFRRCSLKNSAPTRFAEKTAIDPFQPSIYAHQQYNRASGAHFNFNSPAKVVLNTSFESCSVQDNVSPSFQLSSGVANTVIAYPIYINSPVYQASQDIKPDLSSGVGGTIGSTNTVVVTAPNN